jgi:hypothetical protein
MKPETIRIFDISAGALVSSVLLGRGDDVAAGICI